MTVAPEPTAGNCASLNTQFYDGEPWLYFQQRLAHLMLVASDRDRYRAIFAEGVSAGGLTLKIDVNPDTTRLPTPEQSFTAVELEVLLHHSAETLLRFVHGHAEPSPCPWVRMARLTSYQDFKSWVRTAITDAPRDELALLCRQVFTCDPNNAEDLDSCVAYLQLFARHFLDADFIQRRQARDGAARRQRAPPSRNWRVQAAQARRDARELARTLAARRCHASASLDAGFAASRRGCHDRPHPHGNDAHAQPLDPRPRTTPWGAVGVEVFRPVPPDDLFHDRGIRHHVLADVYHPIAADGEQESIIIRSAHFEAPSSDEGGSSERPDEVDPDL